MACYTTIVFLYCFCGLVAVWAQPKATAESVIEVPEDCREETYPCTRMYSVHQPTKTCFHTTCFYSLRRIYVINKELCVKTVCPQEELLKAELCREKSGWPKRLQRSTKKNDGFPRQPEVTNAETEQER
ncbi:microfibril associated protein 5 [Neoarius graeffei]|uniref:microfibril associated protein 5 n=1 Tax=Neoarius graeffei TaxID=443677 RepID=UPI00298C098A|nr:microfibril associated protein 5 [Neoarius graeffei]XP_060776484.1 microfibril associated protein 5 [Neoarius graeffei]XP_060776485.1 microfibril associated protein 5 [Neoarius graeffei]